MINFKITAYDYWKDYSKESPKVSPINFSWHMAKYCFIHMNALTFKETSGKKKNK